MINQYYREFKVKDYMENEITKNNQKFIDCSLGTNPFIKKRRIEKYIKKSKSVINEYPINEYILLKKELLKFYKDNLNENVDSDNISFGSGTMGIIRNLSEFLIEENTKVLGVAPQFTRFISEVELKKGIYEYYPLNQKHNYKFIADDFIKMINNSYSIIYIDNPNNPTGQIIHIKEIEKIVKTARKYGIITIIDEAYGDYMSFDNSSIKLVGKYDNIVVIKSASKFYGLPNHRIGYLFADKDFVKVYDEISIPFPFSDLSANVFINALKDYEKIRITKKKVVNVNKKIYENLKQENYLYTSLETPIFTLKTTKEKDLFRELIKKNIITESGKNFINLDESYVRIRINQKYKELIKTIKQI